MKPESKLHISPVFSELLNAIPHGIAYLDTNLCVVVMNRFLEIMTGYSTAEARGIYSEFIF
ncbi:MAG: sigma-54-dependent Fis family transcriptional regulator, partial [Proteobacteria bacterium]|nr:sigma-54-dependent Fis family transcriptional regulator [Pseudomonadota bacterium]